MAIHHARGAGQSTPEHDEGPELGSGGAFMDQAQTDKGDFPEPRQSRQALQVIEGEAKASQYLARLQALQADPDELALIVSMMYGTALRGFCRVIEKAIGGRHA